MKIKVLLLAFGCSMMSFGAYAQKGVDTGTPFGSGEDSVRCITNLSLMPKQGISRMLMNSGIRLIPNVRELIRISTCMV